MKLLIVGNGPSVAKHCWADFIDEFPEVVRLNRYELTPRGCTGTKTTVWAFAHVFTRTQPFADRGLWVRRDSRPLRTGMPVSMPKMVAGDVDIVSHELWNEIDAKYQEFAPGRHPSSGLVVIAHYLQTHEQLVVHGFDGMVTGQPIHYWEGEVYKDGGHVEAAEKRLMRQWVDADRVVTLAEWVEEIYGDAT